MNDFLSSSKDLRKKTASAEEDVKEMKTRAPDVEAADELGVEGFVGDGL